MQPTEPLALNHSWPATERDQRFASGIVYDEPPGSILSLDHAQRRAIGTIGTWECNLIDDTLTWSDAVYDLFGLPRRMGLCRAEPLALYRGSSRAAMERLRRHAIRHRRGFTLDAEIGTAAGERRWMRLIAAPIAVGGKVVRLHGLKQDVTRLYR